MVRNNQDVVDKERDTQLHNERVRRNKAKKAPKLACKQVAQQRELDTARHEAKIKKKRDDEIENIEKEKKKDKAKKKKDNTITRCCCTYTFKQKHIEKVPICPGSPPAENDCDLNEPFVHAMDHLEMLHNVLISYMDDLKNHLRLNGKIVGRATAMSQN